MTVCYCNGKKGLTSRSWSIANDGENKNKEPDQRSVWITTVNRKASKIWWPSPQQHGRNERHDQELGSKANQLPGLGLKLTKAEQTVSGYLTQ